MSKHYILAEDSGGTRVPVPSSVATYEYSASNHLFVAYGRNDVWKRKLHDVNPGDIVSLCCAGKKGSTIEIATRLPKSKVKMLNWLLGVPENRQYYDSAIFRDYESKTSGGGKLNLRSQKGCPPYTIACAKAGKGRGLRTTASYLLRVTANDHKSVMEILNHAYRLGIVRKSVQNDVVKQILKNTFGFTDEEIEAVRMR